MEAFNISSAHGCAGCDKQLQPHDVCVKIAEGNQQARKDRIAYLQAIADSKPIPQNSATIGEWTQGGPFAAASEVVFKA